MNSFFTYRSARAALAVAILFMLQSFSDAAQESTATSPAAGTGAVAPEKKIVETEATHAAQKTVADFGIECQWRPSADASRFPLLLVYLSNHSDLPVEWGKVLLNQKEAGARTNELAYMQYYPVEMAKPHETVELQLGYAEVPTVPQSIVVETKSGMQISGSIGPFSFPSCRITGVSFSSDYRQLFLTFTSQEEERVPIGLAVNGVDCTQAMRIVEPPNEHGPGLISADLPQPTAQGRPVHVRLQFQSQVTQSIVRACRGICIESSGVGEQPKDQPLRAELGLDAHPAFALINCDPTCGDVADGGFDGKSMPQILIGRRALYASAPERLSYLYLCTTAANSSFSLYSFCTDLVFCNPYRLNWSQGNKFIEAEEQYFGWTSQAAAPHPWGWLPETFCTPSSAAMDITPPPMGNVFDWDAPGLNIPNAPAGEINRTRNNFVSWITVKINGIPVRCSLFRDYFVRFSMRQTQAPNGANWVLINPPDVPNDFQAGNGSTTLSWDLQ